MRTVTFDKQMARSDSKNIYIGKHSLFGMTPNDKRFESIMETPRCATTFKKTVVEDWNKSPKKQTLEN